MVPRPIRFALAFAAVLSIGLVLAQEETHLAAGDAILTGFGPYKITEGPNDSRHFKVEKGAGTRLRMVSAKKGLDATCEQAEGDYSKGLLVQALLTGGVNMKVTRPSSEKTSSARQTATVDGSTAHYTAENNNLHLTGKVIIHDVDPGIKRVLDATGSSGDLELSPQGTKGDPLRSADLEGPVVIHTTGVRKEKAEGSSKTVEVPFYLDSTSDHAHVDYVARTLTLTGHVHSKSDVDTANGVVAKEVIHFNQDGSIGDVEGEGEPGVTTLSTEGVGSP
jgi:lipopolysaccharide export system protein LptA